MSRQEIPDHRIESEMGWCDEHDLPVDKWLEHCRQGGLVWYITGRAVREYDCQVVRGWFSRCLHSGMEVCEMETARQ